MQRVIDAYTANLEVHTDRSCEAVLASGIGFYAAMPRPIMRGSILRAFTMVGQDLGRDPPTAFPTMMHALGEQRSTAGVAIAEMLLGIHIGFEVTAAGIATLFADDLEARLWWTEQQARIGYAGATALADAYAVARERAVRVQADEILRLSAQVLRVHRGVLLLPLHGQLGERMTRISSVLLAAVAAQRARVVLLDISGVPTLDAAVAAALLRTAEAVRLLGATPVLVGVGPDVARAMIGEGVALGALTVRADLEAGLEHARTLVQ